MGGAFTGVIGGKGRGAIARFGASGLPFDEAGGGRLIRRSSRASSLAAPLLAFGGRGGKVIRTVSFFGSFGSLILEVSAARKFV